MTNNTEPQFKKEKAMANDSAQFVHDITTPLAIIQILAKTLETYLPGLLSAHQQLKDQNKEIVDIPQEQYEVLEHAATRIKTLTQEVNKTAKEYWQKIDDQISLTDNTENLTIQKTASPSISFENRLSVLVVEDDAIHQKIAVKLLSGQHLVDLAANGKEAIECCRKKNYDLILMDLHMPVMNGQQAAVEIVQLKSPAPVIIGLTNRPLGGERKELLQGGFSSFLEKPLNVIDLKKLFADCLDS